MYKRYTRADFKRSCAYCFAHEDGAGGERAFGQDHYWPKEAFKALRSTYSNLYWCCCTCNGVKGDHYPQPDEIRQGIQFCDPCVADPCLKDYSLGSDGLLTALTHAGRYTIDHLRLNRAVLVGLRQQWLAARRLLEKAA